MRCNVVNTLLLPLYIRLLKTMDDHTLDHDVRHRRHMQNQGCQFRSSDKTVHLDKSIIHNDGLRDTSIGEHQAQSSLAQ